MVQLSFQVPKGFHPTIIGKGGATVQEIQTKHGVSVHVPSRESPSYAVLITGDERAAQAAKGDIEAALGFALRSDPIVTANFNVPSRHFGRLIGTSGSALKQLQAESGCEVVVPQRSAQSQPVQVHGSVGGIAAAQQLVAKLIGEEVKVAFVESQTSASSQAHSAVQPQDAAPHVAATALQTKAASTDATLAPGTTDATSATEPTPPGSGCGALFASLANLLREKIHIATAPPSLGPQAPTAPTAPVQQLQTPSAATDLRNIHEVLFFPETQQYRGHFNRFLQLLRSATKSVDIAIYTISDDRISRLLMTMHEQGIKVRIFTEQSTLQDKGGDSQSLANVGIPVRYDDSTFLMHLKVAILDGVCVLSGSFNWTRSASEGNTECIIATSSPPVVASFIQQFEQMWPTGKSLPSG